MKCINCMEEKPCELIHYGPHGCDYAVCDDCRDAVMLVCSECGDEVFSVFTSHETVDDKVVCTNCFNRLYIRCGHCEETVRILDAVTINDGQRFCQNCVDEHCFTCEQCDGVFLDEHHGGTNLCAACRSENQNWIRAYNTKFSKLLFNGVAGCDHTKLYLGVELEVDSTGLDTVIPKRDVSDFVSDKRFMFKHDGSLGEAGMEVVTQPCTLEYHKTEMPWKKLLEVLDNYGYDEHCARAGLHVHVNRSFFGKNRSLPELKLLALINNTEDIWKEIVGRGGCGFSKTDDRLSRIKSFRIFVEEYGRRTCVNVLNDQTIEFRIGATTVCPTTLFLRLEFIDAVCRMVRTTSIAELVHNPKRCLMRYIHQEKSCKTIRKMMEA